MGNISPRRCPNPILFLVFDSETADEPILHENSHVPLTKTNMTTEWNSKLSTGVSHNFCKPVEENVPSPYLTAVTPSCMLLKIT
jgi:hypothetical protein